MALHMNAHISVSLKPFATFRPLTQEIAFTDVFLHMVLQIHGSDAAVLTAGPMTCVSFVVQMVFHVLF